MGIYDNLTDTDFFVAPDVGVTPGFARSLVPLKGDLALMSVPQNCPVPTGPTITLGDMRRLSRPAQDFFRGVLRPTIKHV